jgi:H+-transporting ATPase
VLREGTGQEIPAHELMPGDMIHIRLGDIMPADTVPGKGRYLRPDGSALTGESLPVGMKTGDTACSGSIARQGGMDERVTTIRENTFFLKSARLVKVKSPQSHVQVTVGLIVFRVIIPLHQITAVKRSSQ